MAAPFATANSPVREPVITSKENPAIKGIRKILSGKAKDRSDLFLVEGIKLVEEGLQAGANFETILISERLGQSPKGRTLQRALKRSSVQIIRTTDGILAHLSNVVTHQGILAVAAKRKWMFEDLIPADRPALIAVAYSVQDPGNLGTMIRTAEAASSTGFITCKGSADPYSPKAVRATAGSIFRMPLLVLDFKEMIDKLRASDIKLVAVTQQGDLLYNELDYRKSMALIFGSEGSGLPADLIARADFAIKIPMSGAVDSLNVSVAAALTLYEAFMQRRGHLRRNHVT